jgi:hypothetical protein
MVNMPIECVICGTNKNPSLMISIDTCKDCGDKNRHCNNCGANRLAKIWLNGACPECATESVPTTATARVRVSGTNSKPSIIDTLSTLGWVLFAMTGLSGLFLLNQDGGGILGVSLIIAGVFQLSIFLGFSAIIDQLYKINVNTSKPDKSDS